MPGLSSLARNLTAESAFTVLAAARVFGPRGKTSSSSRSATALFRRPRTRNRLESGRSKTTRQATVRAWVCPVFARRRPGLSRESLAIRSRPRTSSSARVPSRSSSILPRRCSTRATECWSSALSFRRTFPTSSARGAGGSRPAASRARFSPFGRGRPAVSLERSQAARRSCSTRHTTRRGAWPLATTWPRSPTSCAAVI